MDCECKNTIKTMDDMCVKHLRIWVQMQLMKKYGDEWEEVVCEYEQSKKKKRDYNKLDKPMKNVKHIN